MPSKVKAGTIGSKTFSADEIFEQWSSESVPKGNDFRTCVVEAFGLSQNDDYVYHAVASVTLAQVQAAVNAGARNGMHDWYKDSVDQLVGDFISKSTMGVSCRA
jgi:hypothetical protein